MDEPYIIDEKDPCFLCELEEYPLQKIMDPCFVAERKNEFYPEEEFGSFMKVCEWHYLAVMESLQEQRITEPVNPPPLYEIDF